MKLKELIEFSSGELIGDFDLNIEILKFSIDSREIDDKTFFVPLIGENSDGHDYIDIALESGALGTFTSKDIEEKKGKIIIKVNDTIEALQNIARKLRENLKDIPLIAITGSVGKTTTKDMVYSVLSSKYKTLKTRGNYNNNIGMPLTLVNYSDEEMLVLEMGMNHFGEISFLSNMAKPDVAIITNIGHSHIGNLGSRENILKAKMEILDGMKESGMLIINGDNDMLKKVQGLKQNVLKFGIENDNDIVAYNIRINSESTEFNVKEDEKEYNIKINLVGEKFIYNALAAWCIGKIYNVSPFDRIKALEKCEYTKMRMNIQTKNGITIINDCYNASPESMKLGIEALKKQEAKRKIAILGDMLELGEYAQKLHEEVGIEVAKNKIDRLYVVGEMAENIKLGAVKNSMKEENIKCYKTVTELLENIKDLIKKEDAVLVKASRAMAFEKIVNELEELNSRT